MTTLKSIAQYIVAPLVFVQLAACVFGAQIPTNHIHGYLSTKSREFATRDLKKSSLLDSKLLWLRAGSTPIVVNYVEAEINTNPANNSKSSLAFSYEFPRSISHDAGLAIKKGVKTINKTYGLLLFSLICWCIVRCIQHVGIPYGRILIARLLVDSSYQIGLLPQDYVLSPAQRLRMIRAVGAMILAIWAIIVVEFYVSKQYPLVDWSLHYRSCKYGENENATALLVSKTGADGMPTSSNSLFDQERAIIAPVEAVYLDSSGASGHANLIKSALIASLDSKLGKKPNNHSTSHSNDVKQYDWIGKTTIGSSNYLICERTTKHFGAEENLTIKSIKNRLCSGRFDVFSWNDLIRSTTEPTIQRFLSRRQLRGLSSRTAKKKLGLFGDNSLDISPPSVQSLLYSKLSSPYFVCQLGLQFLGFIEEGQLEPLLAIVAGVLFDCWECIRQAVILHRYVNAARNMQSDDRSASSKSLLFVNREKGKWSAVSPNDLVPGDLIAVKNPSGSQSIPVPADCLILSGEAVVDESSLTGESVPVRKRQIERRGESLAILRDDNLLKEHTLFTGTILAKCIPAINSPCKYLKQGKQPPGDVLCLVMRTGKSTTIGQMMTRLANAAGQTDMNFDLTSNHKPSRELVVEESISSDVSRTFMLLTASAVIMSAQVYRQEVMPSLLNAAAPVGNTRRISNSAVAQLMSLLRISRLLTRVIPSSLSSDLTYHVSGLARSIPNVVPLREDALSSSGLVTTCLFDKTGTICSDSLHVEQVVHYNCSSHLYELMATAHSIDERGWQRDSHGSGIAGDPLEMCILDFLDKNVTQAGLKHPLIIKDVRTAGSCDQVPPRLVRFSGANYYIGQSHPFDATCQRMSSCYRPVTAADGQSDVWTVACKGSPESILSCLGGHQLSNSSFKSWYLKTYTDLALQGKRVIAYASKNCIGGYSKQSPRTSMESDLSFNGFACLASPVRNDSLKVIQELVLAGIDVKIVSGDSLATCVHVANIVGLIAGASGNHADDNDDVKESVLVLSHLSSRDIRDRLLSIPNRGRERRRQPKLNSADRNILRKAKFDNVIKGEKLSVWSTVDGNICGVYGKGNHSMGGLGYKNANSLGSTIKRLLPQWSAEDIHRMGYVPAMDGSSLCDPSPVSATSNASSATLLPRDWRYFKILARSDPRSKGAVVHNLQRDREVVMMVGDGMNDIAALAAADVGIAIPHVDVLSRDRHSSRNVTQDNSANNQLGQLGNVCLVAHFSATRASIRSAVDVIRYGRLSHGLYLLNHMIAIVEPLISGYMITRGYQFRLSTVHNYFLGPLSLLLNRALSMVQPLPTLKKTTLKKSIFSAQFLLLMTVQFIAHKLVLDTVFSSKDASALPSTADKRTYFGEEVFPIFLMQFPLLIVSNFVGSPLMRPIHDSLFLSILLALSLSAALLFQGSSLRGTLTLTVYTAASVVLQRLLAVFYNSS